MRVISADVLEFHSHRDNQNNDRYVIPDVAVAHLDTYGHEDAVTLEQIEVLGEGLEDKGFEPALLEAIAVSMKTRNRTSLDSLLCEPEPALHLRKAFGSERASVEQYNAATWEFEDADLSLDGLIVLMQCSPLRTLPPSMRQTYRVTVDLAEEA